jgi:glycosyltransferase involved in cell wall biosynthesis
MAYQNAPYIRECIDSVLMQKTDFPFEICIGEDGSTDGTREICLKYQEKYPDILRVFLWDRTLPEHKALPPSRYNFINTIKKCQGKYIALLDGDDYWTNPMKLQKQVEFLEQNTHHAGCFHETRHIGDLKKTNKFHGKTDKDVFTTEDTIAIGTPFHSSAFVFNRALLKFPYWFSRIVSADMALFSLVSKHGPLRAIHEVMSVYRHHDGGITKSKKVKDSYHEQRIELMKFLNEYHDRKYQNKVDRVIEYHLKALEKERIKNDKFLQTKIWVKNKLRGLR